MTYTRQQFIEKLAPYAIKDMKESGVPASLTIAQGILESADGNSGLAIQANNLFGHKGTGTAGSVTLPTREFVNNQWVTVQAAFRKYNNWGESVADHSALFLNGVSWNRNLYKNVIGKDGITAAKEVARAGYATDPEYAYKLINIINENKLLQYDIQETAPAKEADPFTRLIELMDKLHSRMAAIESKQLEVPAPDWLLVEFPNALDIINQKTGTADFWRGYAITLRALNQFQNNFAKKA